MTTQLTDPYLTIPEGNLLLEATRHSLYPFHPSLDDFIEEVLTQMLPDAITHYKEKTAKGQSSPACGANHYGHTCHKEFG